MRRVLEGTIMKDREFDDDEIDYSGIHSLNLGDSLEFGTEFDIATGKRR